MFIRTKCLSPHCPAMACPSQTGYCSHHDLERTPVGCRPTENHAEDVGGLIVTPPVPRFLWEMPQGNA
jgi:hypothetical protein